MTRRLVVIVAVGLVGFVLAKMYGPGAVQERGIQHANEFRDRALPPLAADARFARVKLLVTTNPALLVMGNVADEKALEDLHRIIQPPTDQGFGIGWLVKVDSGVTSRPGQ